MPIHEAHELNLKPAPKCHICGTVVTASGERQPIALDDSGRPYCRTHGHVVAADHDALLAEYDRIRAAQAALINEAEEEGISPAPSDIEMIRAEWHAPV